MNSTERIASIPDAISGYCKALGKINTKDFLLNNAGLKILDKNYINRRKLVCTDYLNFSMAGVVKFEMDGNKIGSFLVSRKILEDEGISCEEFILAARKNAFC